MLSPEVALLGIRDALAGIDAGSLALSSAEGPIGPPMSWSRVTLPGSAISLLITRAQPGLAAGEVLDLTDELGGRARISLHPAADLRTLIGPTDPATTLRVLNFIVSRIVNMLRRPNDAALAAACHAFATPPPASTLNATAGVLCGRDAVFWSLPPGLAPGNASSFVLGRQRMRLVSHDGAALVLADRGFEDGYLLAAGGDGPIRLAAATGPLPTLGELARRQDGPARATYRAAIGELVRRAPADAEVRRMLRDHQLLSPVQAFSQATDAAEPFGGSLELAVDDHDGGLFLRGWLRDPLGLVSQLGLVGSFGEQPLPLGLLSRFPRPDLMKTYADAPHGGPDGRAGFVVHLPQGAMRPSTQWRLRVRLTTGDQVMLVGPAAITSPGLARDRILGAIAPTHVTPEIMARCIAPPVERLHRRVMAMRGAPEVVRIGTPVPSPSISLVIPIYRNVHYLRHQLGALARDPTLREAEVIYVLDSPEQRENLEHMLRGYHGIHRMPVTLVVQPSNYGYGSACNAGAAEARAPVLLLLNSDVVPAGRGWVLPLLESLAAAPGLAAIGPKLLFANGSVQHAGLYFEQLEMGEWYNSHFYKGMPRHFPPAQVAREVPGITGAAFCVRRDAYQAIGGISTDYVVGDYEDSDLSLRLRANGDGIGYVPACELYHFERQSIMLHTGYTRTLAGAYNRGLHHRRWAPEMERLMARSWSPGPAQSGLG
jgi:GT2 family glycosyltransferase